MGISLVQGVWGRSEGGEWTGSVRSAEWGGIESGLKGLNELSGLNGLQGLVGNAECGVWGHEGCGAGLGGTRALWVAAGPSQPWRCWRV